MLVVCLPIWAWDSTGHRIIAAIAYQHLTPVAKQRINQLTRVMFRAWSPRNRFFAASVWPDKLRKQGDQRYNQWHFISYPLHNPHHFELANQPDNVVWAIRRSERILRRADTNKKTQAKNLSFLMHFVGDAHQPMHCITSFRHHWFTSDRGGNLYPIKTHYANNLHAFWDEAAGWFHMRHQHFPLRYYEVERLAAQLQLKYPPAFFAGHINNLNPRDWTIHSYRLAKKYAYDTPRNRKPSRAYVRMARRIAEQQLALAGYRLAAILNTICGR